MYKQRHILVGRDIYIAVVRAFDPSFSGKSIYDQVLVAISIGHAQPDGQHKLGEVKLIWMGRRKLLLSLAFPSYLLLPQKFQVALNIRVQHFFCTFRNFIAIFIQPCFKPALSFALNIRISYSPTRYFASIFTTSFLQRPIQPLCSAAHQQPYRKASYRLLDSVRRHNRDSGPSTPTSLGAL